MKNADLLAKRPPDNKHRFDQLSKIREVFDKLPDARLELQRSHNAHLEAGSYAKSRASLRSVLLICACNTARMCRVSTQITGRPASASALKSHCDSGPASSPIRLKRQTGFDTTDSRASGSLATFTSRTSLPVSSTMHTLVSLTDTSNPAK